MIYKILTKILKRAYPSKPLLLVFQGEYDYPDPSKWTDAELGIPPDDE